MLRLHLRHLLLASALFLTGIGMIHDDGLAADSSFSPSSPPTSTEWQKFNQMTPAERAGLWRHFSSRGVGLSRWAWQWRIGWVRSCASSDSHQLPCPEILKSGLRDAAVVVRAESAQSIGVRYQNQPNSPMIVELEGAFSDPRNRRHGEPLFVCDRILMAMRQIGGKTARAKAKNLAAANTRTKNYWQKIQNTKAVKM